MHPLTEWWNSATLVQKQTLAQQAGTTLESLRQAIRGYRNGRELHMGVDLAGRIADHLPSIVQRRELCQTCATCPHALKDVKKPRRKKTG